MGAKPKYERVLLKISGEALAGERAMACAGATNLYVDRRHGKYLDFDYVSLEHLTELRGIRREADGWHIGSMTSFSELERCGIPFAGALVTAASQVGGPQIRNRGTVGGNIISASPAADSVPPLLALDAVLRLVKAGGISREVALKDFMKGPGRTDLRHGELLAEVILPHKSGRSVFYKAGKRNALAISLCSCAVYMEERQGAVGEIAVALGSVAPTAVRAEKAEKVLAGTRLADLCRRELAEADKEAAAEVRKEAAAELAGEVSAEVGGEAAAEVAGEASAELAGERPAGLASCAPACPAEPAFRERLRAALMEDIAPIADIRATAEYRRRIAFRMVLHNVTELWRCFE